MSAHLFRFLMTVFGMLSLHSATPYSLVDPRWLADTLIRCQRLRPVRDDELERMDPHARVEWMLDAYGALLTQLAPGAVRAIGGPQDLDPAVFDRTFADVRARLPLLEGDLSIDAVNEAIGLRRKKSDWTEVAGRRLADHGEEGGPRSPLSRNEAAPTA